MRKITYGINLSADGCCEHTSVNSTEGIHEYFTALMKDVDLLIYGRKTYELMVPYWPDVAKSGTGKQTELEFARIFTSLKVVFSRTLDSVEANTTLLRSNLYEEVIKLKQQPGKNISIGGIDLPGKLIALGLVDEFYFVVHPVLTGQGRRLLDGTNLQEKFNMELVSSNVIGSGCVALHYIKQ